jgi:hypothetical protein
MFARACPCMCEAHQFVFDMAALRQIDAKRQSRPVFVCVGGLAHAKRTTGRIFRTAALERLQQDGMMVFEEDKAEADF